jgi:hypothetical protein
MRPASKIGVEPLTKIGAAGLNDAADHGHDASDMRQPHQPPRALATASVTARVITLPTLHVGSPVLAGVTTRSAVVMRSRNVERSDA